MACIYCCKRKEDNKVVYVGLTTYTLSFRLTGEPYGHFVLAFKKNSQTYFHKALRKYGKDAFVFEVIEERQESDFIDREAMNSWLNEREKHWIAYYDTFNNGYNQTTGGHDFYHRSEENKRITSETTKRAMSKLDTKELCNPTKYMTEEEKIEWRKKVSLKVKEAMSKLDTKELCNPTKYMTEEEKQAYIERCNVKKRGKLAWNSGKHSIYSEETIKKISNGLKQYCWITNGTITKHIKRIELNEWLLKGYRQGSTKHSFNTAGKKVMHKQNIQKYVKPEDIQSMLNQGWILGGTKRKRKET